MAGSAILRYLQAAGLGMQDFIVRTHRELDLTSQSAVRAFFSAGKA